MLAKNTAVCFKLMYAYKLISLLFDKIKIDGFVSEYRLCLVYLQYCSGLKKVKGRTAARDFIITKEDSLYVIAKPCTVSQSKLVF